MSVFQAYGNKMTERLEKLHQSDSRGLRIKKKKPKEALDRYTAHEDSKGDDAHHLRINQYTLSQSGEVLPKRAKEQHEKDAYFIEGCFENHAGFSSASYLYRGVNRVGEAQRLRSLEVGEVFIPRFFMSSSYLPFVAFDSFCEQDIIIRISKGHGLALSGTNEIEFLFNWLSRFRVTAMNNELWSSEEGQREILVIDMEQLHP